MKTFTTNHFKRVAKKLHRNQIPVLEKAIETIQSDPALGESKVGDLLGVRVYKFHILSQLMLLAYTYDESVDEMMLLYVAPHENFYDALKKQIKS